ncbi:zinc finger CCCH domain-containing protein 3-like [Selaginella moellendorffii]|uniref:zinc finger CCCH domain-containing protein 3-like n=1 Tax=Selaginella moellendorffii TaxID=88036 RepID=UPI000D1CD6BE|nr:zinc finger CCCH domain-containing protein 3-like [Selaginella moellendorffii]|eukprot:XP_024519940.1 zinc finger CCCH domain-containing protein 3-like [Selaginella moellendorffii]
MPAPKYHCDYCDKTFVDGPAARRKHLQSPYHQITKKAWFDSFRDPAELLAENPNRGICAKFTRTGNCEYGFRCKYIHPARSSQTFPAGGPRNAAFSGRFAIPPSLQPPPEEGYAATTGPVPDWG